MCWIHWWALAVCWTHPWDFPRITPCHLQTVSIWPLSLQSGLFFFLFLIQLVCVSKTFNAMLSKSGKNRHTCLVPDLKGKFSAFHHRHDVSCLLSHTTFIMLSYGPSICTLWRCFLKNVYIINGYWILLKVFPASTEVIIWSLFFILLMWYIIKLIWGSMGILHARIRSG